MWSSAGSAMGGTMEGTISMEAALGAVAAVEEALAVAGMEAAGMEAEGMEAEGMAAAEGMAVAVGMAADTGDDG